ncbi:MAG: protein kinase [Myxococcota bacterium]
MAVPPREFQAEGRIVPVARLGVGGMGEVLLARRTGALGFEKLIAVKTIRADRAHHEEARRMFTDEARLLARLDHPSIAQVYDLGEQDGVLYLAMEYVPGIALGTWLSKKKSPFPPGIAAQIVAAAARGLNAAHELADLDGRPLGVVHRDISPQNVMVGFDGRVKVLDFGVAWMRYREAQSTETGAVKGKLAYLAPEQIKSRPIDRRTDIYALSIVLYELLTAKRLFGGDGSSLAAALRRPKISPPSSKESAVSPELDAIVMRGLETDKDLRWPDARSMALALEEEVKRIGGESLEAYALRELAPLAQENKAFLKRAMETPEAIGFGATVELSSVVSSAIEPPARGSGRWWFLLALLATAAALFFGRSVELPTVAPPRSAPPVIAEPSVGPLPPTATVAMTSSSARAIAALAGITRSATVALAALVPEITPDTEAMAALAEASEEDETETSSAAAEPSTPPIPRGAPVAAAPRTNLPRPPPDRRVPAPAYGSLTLLARAGGTVFVDGKKLGATPLLRRRLEAGAHVLALRRPGDPRPRWQAHAIIHPGRHLSIELK